MSEARRVAWVLCTSDDPFVRLTLSMVAFEIGVIMSDHSTLVGAGVPENVRIVNALTSPTCILYCPHVVPETAQFLDNRQREILISIEPGHEWLVCLVVANVFIYFGAVLSVVIPSCLEVVGHESHNVHQDLFVRQTEPP